MKTIHKNESHFFLEQVQRQAKRQIISGNTLTCMPWFSAARHSALTSMHLQRYNKYLIV